MKKKLDVVCPIWSRVIRAADDVAFFRPPAHTVGTGNNVEEVNPLLDACNRRRHCISKATACARRLLKVIAHCTQSHRDARVQRFSEVASAETCTSRPPVTVGLCQSWELTKGLISRNYQRMVYPFTFSIIGRVRETGTYLHRQRVEWIVDNAWVVRQGRKFAVGN